MFEAKSEPDSAALLMSSLNALHGEVSCANYGAWHRWQCCWQAHIAAILILRAQSQLGMVTNVHVHLMTMYFDSCKATTNASGRCHVVPLLSKLAHRLSWLLSWMQKRRTQIACYCRRRDCTRTDHQIMSAFCSVGK